MSSFLKLTSNFTNVSIIFLQIKFIFREIIFRYLHLKNIITWSKEINMRLLFFNLILFLLSGKFICKTVNGKFNHCNNKFCEEVEEIEVVQYFDKCTEYPYVKFFSKHLGKTMDGFLNQIGDLITDPQVEIPCNRKVKLDNYRDFSIEREDHRARVIESLIDKKTDEIINVNYFKRPLKNIIKDYICLAFLILILILIIVYRVAFKNFFVRILSYCAPHWLNELRKQLKKNKIENDEEDKKTKKQTKKNKEKFSPIKVIVHNPKADNNSSAKRKKANVSKNSLISDDEDSFINEKTNRQLSFYTPTAPAPQHFYSPLYPPLPPQIIQQPIIHQFQNQPQIHSTLHSQHIPNHHSQNQPVVQSTSQNLHQQSQTNSHTQPLHSTNQLHSQTNSHIQPHIQPQIQSQIQQHTQPHHSTNQLQSPTHSYIQPNTQTYHSINQLQSPSLSSNILQPMLNQGQPITPIRQGSVLIPAYDTLPSFQPSPHIPMNRSPPFSPIRMETNGGKSPCPLCPSRYQTEKGIKQHCRMTHPQYELTLKNRLWGYIFRGQ
jgi:hypothetical protein